MAISSKILDYTVEEKDSIDILNPATDEVIGKVSMATEEDAEKGLTSANKAQKSWASTPIWKRGEILNKFADLVDENRPKLANLLSLESGKPITQAEGELTGVSRIVRGFVEKAKHVYGKNIPLDHQPGIENDVYITRREPLGVIVGIVPFNYPTDIFTHKVAPALITGNAIIIKPPRDTPLTILKLEELYAKAGLPKNVLQVINGPGSTVGQKLVSSSLTNGVTVTGGTDTGIDVASTAIKQLSRVSLELGGNDPFIVFEDADIEKAVEEAIAGRIGMNGQTCIANKRMIIHQSKEEEFTNLLLAKVKELKSGNPQDRSVDIGPIINAEALKKIDQQVKHTIEQGAKLLFGGDIVDNAWYEPTILTDVKPDFDIATDMEVFGPVFPIITFNTEEEAISIANNSCYGLNGAVFTNDVNRAVNIGYKIESGIIAVNGASSYRPDVSYFGGYKMSGYTGNEGFIGAIDGMTQVKSVALRNSLKIFDSY